MNNIYKTIISIAILITFEFTIGKELKQLNEKFEVFGTPEGRKNIVSSLKKKLKSYRKKII